MKNARPDWAKRIREEFALPPEIEAILCEAEAGFERLQQITQALEGQPLMFEGPRGAKANPLIAAERAARDAYVPCLRALNLPEEN